MQDIRCSKVSQQRQCEYRSQSPYWSHYLTWEYGLPGRYPGGGGFRGGGSSHKYGVDTDASGIWLPTTAKRTVKDVLSSRVKSLRP